MSNETTITIVGNLVDGPDLRFTTAGQPFVRFRIASTPRYRGHRDRRVEGRRPPVPDLRGVAPARREHCRVPREGHAGDRHWSHPAACLRVPGRREAHRLRAPGRRRGPVSEPGYGKGRAGQPLGNGQAVAAAEASRTGGDDAPPF